MRAGLSLVFLRLSSPTTKACRGLVVLLSVCFWILFFLVGCVTAIGLRAVRSLTWCRHTSVAGGFIDGEAVGCVSAVIYGSAEHGDAEHVRGFNDGHLHRHHRSGGDDVVASFVKNSGSAAVQAKGCLFGFLGLYIVRQDYRGRGLGLRLFRAALDRLAGCTTVGLDGVVAQQSNYAKSGFVKAHNDVRFEGPAAGIVAKARSGARGESSRVSGCTVRSKTVTAATACDGVQLLAAHEVAFQMVVDYDAQCFGAPRGVFLQTLLSQPGTIALVAVRDVAATTAITKDERRGAYGDNGSDGNGGGGEGRPHQDQP